MRTIVFYVPSIMPGGAERVCVNLANYLSEETDVNIWLMAKYGGIYDPMVSKNVNRIELRGKSIAAVLFLLYKIKPDVIMSTMASANVRLIFIKVFLFTKTLFVTRAPAICQRWVSYQSLKSKILNYLGNNAYRFSDFVIANSPDTAKSIEKICRVPSNRIYTIGNPVLFKSQLMKVPISEYGNDTYYILAVGSFKPIKRYDLMLNMFKRVSERTDLNLHIIGGGNQEAFIRERIKELGIENRVKLLGIKNNLENDYRAAKCFVLCSEFEGFGNVIVEAMAQGLVPICFNCPGGPSYILEGGKYGVLVPFGDIDAMAQAVIDVASEKIHFDKEALVNRAKFFSIEEKAAEYFTLFKVLYQQKYGIQF